MKRPYWLLSAALFLCASARADDGWQKALAFPLTSNSAAAGRAATFTDPADGFTYAYFGANTASGAQIWRSSDGVSWNQVNVNGFDTQNGKPHYDGVAWISSYTVAGSSYVYVGVTPNNALGSGIAIYRSAGGSSTAQWSQVLSSATLGSAVASDPGQGPGLPFNSGFYFGTTNSASGTHVWKSTSADGLSWTVVSQGGFGEGAAGNPSTTYLKPFGGNLYLATGCPAAGSPCGQLWKSTGTVNPSDIDNWTQILAATNTTPGTFDAATYSITALESFNGYLYAATANSAGKAQLLRTTTPDTGGWTAQTTSENGCATCFAALQSTAVFSLRSLDGYLYASVYSANGLVVYRTSDGTTWTRSNTTAGFNTNNNQSLGDFALIGTTVLGDTLNGAGGALWSALLPGAAGQPGKPSATAATQTSITWTWSTVAAATSYNVYESSSPGTLLTNTAAPPFTEMGLSSNTLDGIVVTAVNSVGSSILSASGQTYTLAAPPTSFALVSVFSSSITLSWAANGNPAGTNYQVQYWLTGGATTTVTTAADPLTLNGLLDGDTYFMTVNALNGNNVSTPSGTTLSTFTISVPSLATIVTPAGGTILFNTPSGISVLAIPPNAFTQNVIVTLSTTVAADFPVASAPAAVLTPTGVGLQVSLSPSVEPLRTVTIVVPFTAAEVSGFDVSELDVSRYDSVENVWVPLASSPSAANGQVTAITDHLSLFQIMQSTLGSSVSGAKAFPNPLRPALGETYMTFSLLPAGARVRIYTLTGILVKDLTADSTGAVDWDGTNDAGANAASGVYFVYAQAGGQHRTLKVAIQR